MAVSSYQIHQVLKVFSRRLYEQRGGPGPAASGEPAAAVHGVSIAEEGKRRSIPAAVTADIVNRLTGACVYALGKEAGRPTALPAGVRPAPPAPGDFIYHLVDACNRKVRASLRVEDAEVLIGRLGEPAAGEPEGL